MRESWISNTLWRIKRFLRKLKKTLSWAWYIYHEDEDWDYEYIFTMLRRKLQYMHPVITNGPFTTSKSNGKKMKLAIALLDRIIEFPYYDMVKDDDDVRFAWRKVPRQPEIL